MPFLSSFRKPQQIQPMDRSLNYNVWSLQPEEEKCFEPFVHVPLSPPMNRYSPKTGGNGWLACSTQKKLEMDELPSYRSMYSKQEDQPEENTREMLHHLFCCLPPWARTGCCFLLWWMILLLGLGVVLMTTLHAPKIRWVATMEGNQVHYELENPNFFRFQWEHTQVIAYYSGVVQSIHQAELGPISLPANAKTSLTVTLQTLSHQHITLLHACQQHPEGRLTVTFDFMPTISLFHYSLITAVFSGQKIETSCEKLLKTKDWL
ncbi:hypothetical protein BY458DRAFT_486078 [Sporodiniella umbellata]|nr:hypothetical protein BY458DRAFT_486078 [Sporodiniella umbellata]